MTALNPTTVIGLVVALGGVAVLLVSGDSGLATGGHPVLAAAYVAAAGAFVSVTWVFLKLYGAEYRPTDLTTVQMITAIVPLWAMSFGMEGLPDSYGLEIWWLVAYLALLAQAVPFFLIFWAIARASVIQTMLMAYLTPIIAVVAGVIILDEQLQSGILLGGALILVGVLVTDRAQRAMAPT